MVVEGNRRSAALKYLYEQYKSGNDVGKLTQESFKKSDFGDQFQANKYFIFEEVVKKVEMKAWLQWNDDTYQTENKVNEERLFSWISKEEVIERDEESGEELEGTIHLFNNREPELYYQKSKVLCAATFSSPYRFDDDLLIKADARAVENRYLDEIVAFINSKILVDSINLDIR